MYTPVGQLVYIQPEINQIFGSDMDWLFFFSSYGYIWKIAHLFSRFFSSFSGDFL